MRVLVIPDVHLKPWMFQRATEIMKQQEIDQAVCLMDIADDWRQEYNIDLYVQTYDAAIDFATKHPTSLWCYGNHDICYVWNQRETGYSSCAAYTVQNKIAQLQSVLPDEHQLAFIHRIDNVLFMHGGLSTEYINRYMPVYSNNINQIIETINSFGVDELWHSGSPIWMRPAYSVNEMYCADKYLQVVGHTPTKCILRKDEKQRKSKNDFMHGFQNYISCDVFSLSSDRMPIGSQEFLIVDTESWNWKGVR